MGKLTGSVIFMEFAAVAIMLGTAIDIFWSVALADTLFENELNPVAKWVIGWGNEVFTSGRLKPGGFHFGVATLCFLKIMSTCFALRVCRYISGRNLKWGLAVYGGMALFQIGLVLFLFFGHLITG